MTSSVLAAHIALLAEAPDPTHETSRCRVCALGERAEERVPEQVTFTEDEVLAKIADAVKAEVASQQEALVASEAKAAAAEARITAAEEKAAAAEQALIDFHAGIEAAAQREERSAERAAAVKAVAPFLTEQFLADKAEAWADMDEAGFQTVLAVYGEAAKAAPHEFRTASEDAAETACATCGSEQANTLHVKVAAEAAAEATTVETAAFKGGVVPQAPAASKNAARAYRDLLRSRQSN